MGFLLRLLRRITLGKPIPTWLAMHQRLPKFLALPIFASDAMSSVAYATDEIILVLALAGTGALNNVPWIAVAIVALLAIVATSYRQTIFAYPSGGGSYIVARDNLGVTFGLIAAASILTDYVLTVAVSIASGVLNIISAYPVLRPHLVWMCLGAIALVAIANLRGLKESGTLFAGPAYAYIVSFVIMIVGGFVKWRMGTLHPVMESQAAPAVVPGLTVFLVLRAFAGGCSAMTGTEAVADGVPAFRPPESKNAAATLVYMALVLGTLFLGISVLAHILGISSVKEQTVISQISGAVFGRTWMYFGIQFVTMAILVLAAQTSFADFPRLSSILARDRFMPRQLANIGDRLVFQNGIVALWVLASVLIIVFQGDVHKLIPLYAIGVFMSFTLSQAGMVVHTRRLKERNWRLRVAISTVGAATTALVVVVAAVAKAAEGAWIVIIIIPLLVLGFRKVNGHYKTFAEQLRLPPEPPEVPEMRNTVLVLVPGIHKGVIPAIQYAKSLSPDCRAVYIETDPADTPLIEERWEKWGMGIPLVVLESPFRSVVQPILKYLDEVKKDRVRHVVTVVIPEFVPAKFWHKIMHNQSGILLKFALLFKKDIVVTNVRYYLEK